MAAVVAKERWKTNVPSLPDVLEAWVSVGLPFKNLQTNLKRLRNICLPIVASIVCEYSIDCLWLQTTQPTK